MGVCGMLEEEIRLRVPVAEEIWRKVRVRPDEARKRGHNAEEFIVEHRCRQLHGIQVVLRGFRPGDVQLRLG